MSRWIRLPLLVALFSLLGLGVVALHPLGANATPGPCAPAPTPNPSTCVVQQLTDPNTFVSTFSPNDVILDQTAGIEWQNASIATHTSNSDATTGPYVWSSGNMAPNTNYTFTFGTTLGSFTYHCAIHAFFSGGSWHGMVGTVQVSAPTATRVARFLAHWSKGQTRISWRMAEVHNIAGFLVYAGHQRLTKQVIPASPGRRSYHLSAHVTRTAQLYLDVVLNTGKVNLFGPYRSR